MDRLERVDDVVEAVRVALAGAQASIWTALPCVIKSFNASTMTCEAKPAIPAQVRDADGQWKWVDLPLLVDCPVVFPGGGGFTLTFPVAEGDECLMILASRCIDGWWQSGASSSGTSPLPPDLRMHDLSDGFALVGLRSRPRALSRPVDAENVELRSDAGTDFVRMTPGGDMVFVCRGDFSVQAGGQATITGTQVNIHGPQVNNSTIAAAGNVTGAGISLNSHHHSDPQGGSTGGPT
jgi:hypothetical protein